MRLSCTALLLSLLGPLCGHAETALTVELVRAHLNTTTSLLAVTGEIQATYSFGSSARTGGRLLAVHVNVGDTVAEGQILAELDRTQAIEAVRAAEAQRTAAEATLRQAMQAHGRARDLLESGAGTRAGLDAAEEALLAARSRRDQAEAQLSKARQGLSDTVVRADGAAIVTQRLAEPGQIVSPAQPILVLARDNGREAVFQAPDGLDLTALLGREIDLRTLDAPILDLKATVTEISPLADVASGTVEITARLSDDSPRPGLGAAITGNIAIGEPEAFNIPWSALAVWQGKPAVWVADPQTLRVTLTPVEVSHYTDHLIGISDGLRDGDMVVGAGSNFLYPGRLVRPAGEE